MERVGPRILSLESVDYSWNKCSKKNRRILLSETSMVSLSKHWSGFVNFHCMQWLFTIYKMIQLESKWNTWLFWSFQRKIPGSNGTSEKVVLFFFFSGRNIPNRNSCSTSSKPPLIPASFRISRWFSGKCNWFVQMVKAIQGRNLLRCKWQ